MGLLGKAGNIQSSDNAGPCAAFKGNLFLFLKLNFAKASPLSCLLFEADAPEHNFVDRVAYLTGDFASVSGLKKSRCLILGDASLDAELLAHRLSASVRGKKLLVFNAKNSREAFQILKPCL